jgi:hypothetical protein
VLAKAIFQHLDTIPRCTHALKIRDVGSEMSNAKSRKTTHTVQGLFHRWAYQQHNVPLFVIAHNAGHVTNDIVPDFKQEIYF